MFMLGEAPEAVEEETLLDQDVQVLRDISLKKLH
jgi:hypothetical protein